MIKFIEVLNETQFNPRMERTATPRFSLGEVWINENYVVSLKKAPHYDKLLEEGRLPNDLDTQHQFTTIVVNNGSITESHVVVGDLATVAGRVQKHKKTLLKG